MGRCDERWRVCLVAVVSGDFGVGGGDVDVVCAGWFGSANASAFHLLNPIFATILAWWFFQVELGISDMIGTLMVMGALGLLHKSRMDNEKRQMALNKAELKA